MVKNLPAVQEARLRFLGEEDPLEKKWQATSVFLPGELHRQRSWRAAVHGGHRESDAAEQSHTHTGST